MRNYLLILLILLSGKSFLSAQNLVPNPGFENPRNKRPSMFPWQMVNTIDYFVYDESKKGQIVKSKIKDKNFRLRQARTGVAYVGLRVWPNYTEFLIVELHSPLEKSKQYYFEMYVSISSHANSYLKSLGVSFYSFKPHYAQKQAVWDFPPQIRIYKPQGIAADSTGWVKLAGVFTAEGGERFMSIGNFSRNNADKLKRRFFGLGKREAYYYIDDVALYKLDESGFPITSPPDSLQATLLSAQTTSYDFIRDKAVDDYYRTVHFPPGSAELNNEAYQKLAFVIEYLIQKPDVSIHIIGLSANNDNHNIEEQIRLAQRRARSVSMFITGNRINKNRLFLAFNISGCNEQGTNNVCSSAEILFSDDPDDQIRIREKNFNLMQ
jgi:OmpA-OmpF porin, OOP family